MANSNFFSLPLELRRMVYRQYFGVWTPIISCDVATGRYKLSGVPRREIYLTCKAIYEESRPLLLELFSGEMDLKDLRMRPSRITPSNSSLVAVLVMEIDLLLKRTHTLMLENGTTRILNYIPWDKYPLLRNIELVECAMASTPLMNSYSIHWPFESASRPQQQPIARRIIGYDYHTYVPNLIVERQVRVFVVRKHLTSGIMWREAVEYKVDAEENPLHPNLGGSARWKWTTVSMRTTKLG